MINSLGTCNLVLSVIIICRSDFLLFFVEGSCRMVHFLSFGFSQLALSDFSQWFSIFDQLAGDPVQCNLFNLLTALLFAINRLD